MKARPRKRIEALNVRRLRSVQHADRANHRVRFENFLLSIRARTRTFQIALASS